MNHDKIRTIIAFVLAFLVSSVVFVNVLEALGAITYTTIVSSFIVSYLVFSLFLLIVGSLPSCMWFWD